MRIGLPAGLSIGRRDGGIRVTHGRGEVRFAAHPVHGGVDIGFTRPQSGVRIILRRPTLFASTVLATLARAHRRAKVVVHVTTTDRRHRRTSRRVRLRLAR